jgi:CelD/BcsL family acetyltransferase involved in cellulose biosynthesis
MGKLEFKIETEAPTVDYYMNLYYQVYEKSWKAPEPDPMFHRQLAKLGAEKGWLRLGFLFFNDSPIASQLWLTSKKIAYIVKLVYDVDFKKFIPGIILTSEMMKYAIDVDGVEYVDYLIGDESYKKDWMPLRRQRSGIHILNNNIKGYLLDGLFRGAHILNKLRRH